MFPTEESAREWFEARVWPDGRYCPHSAVVYPLTHEAGHNPCPIGAHCRSYFCVKTGMMRKRPHPTVRKWVSALPER